MPFLELEGQPDLEDNPRELNGELVVGSGSQASWRISRRDLAARHFVILGANNGGARVVPASPQNIVVLNGKQASNDGTALRTGDVIAAGSARFIFLAGRDSERPQPVIEPVPAFLVDHKARKGYALQKRVIQIGREIGCAIVLRDPTVSRFHADIRSEGGEYVLYSLGSTGTRINDAPVTTPRLLQEGDRIGIGDTTFVYSRQPLPPAIKAANYEDHTDDNFSRRHTQLLDGPIVADPGRSRARRTSFVPWAVGAAIVAILVVVALVMLR